MRRKILMVTLCVVTTCKLFSQNFQTENDDLALKKTKKIVVDEQKKQNIVSELPDIMHVRGSVYYLRPHHPKFGNPSTVVSVGKDGVFMADVGPHGLEEGLMTRLKEIGNSKVKYVVTTHHHGDHTEGLVYFSKIATLICPINQRPYLANSRIFLDGGSHKKESLPELTFEKSINVFLNDEEIKVFSLPNNHGHTGGDAIVYFKTSDVLYVGDYLFLDHFPIIDLNNGGSVDGFLNNIKYITETFSDSTLVVPGHGTLRPAPIRIITIRDYKKYYQQLKKSVEWIKSKMEEGRQLDEILADGLPEEFKSFDENYIYISSKHWINIVHEFYSLNQQ